MEVETYYKETEVGTIPLVWDVKSIDEMGTIQTGPFGTLLKASEYSTEGRPLISVGEIKEGFIEIDKDTPRIPPTVLQRLPPNYTTKIVRDGRER